MATDPRRSVPRVDHVLADNALESQRRLLGDPLVKAAVADALEQCRQGTIQPQDVVAAVLASLPADATGQRRVLNATGVIVHTNLGRAPLSAAATQALITAAGTTDVEFDLATGRRSTRGRGALDALAAAVPAAERVLVVNNGAAALSLAGHTLAFRREVVVARGELVEIGDGFRLPELLTASGVTLVEVGTTNRVRLGDYQEAIRDGTGFVLKVNPSNFVVTGFTSSVSVRELATLPAPLVVDIGSGLLQPHPRLPDEPDAETTLRDGASLVTASADKLLGGPQAGLVMGRADLVERLRRHPTARAFRVDKLTLAALEATLRGPRSPVARALDRTAGELLARARAVADLVGSPAEVEAVTSTAVVGGGGAPGVELTSAAVSIDERYTEALRAGSPAVVGHVRNGRILLDLIALEPADDRQLADAIAHVIGMQASEPRT